MFRNLPPITRSLIAALAVTLLLSLVTQGGSSGLFALYGDYVLNHYQFWRLVTYPFASHSFFPVLAACALIYYFGTELETIVHARTLGVFVAVAVVSGGLIFIFLDPQGIVVSPGFLSLFFLSGFTYLWPKRQISIFGMFWVRAWVISVILFLVSIVPMESHHMDLSAANLFPPFYTVISALVLFHIKYRQYALGRGLLRSFDNARPDRVATNAPRSIETEIDMILDKISTKGMESLSKQEREFLMKHTGK
jgi:rhomboid family protein